jgi:hypothetical protein
MHLTYDIKDNLTAGIRTEWFRDQNGFRVWSPQRIAAASSNGLDSYASGGLNSNYSGSNFGSGASYYGITAGLNWKPVKWLNIRPNVRYDWADGVQANGSNRYLPFGNNNRDSQFLFSSDFNVNF